MKKVKILYLLTSKVITRYLGKLRQYLWRFGKSPTTYSPKSTSFSSKFPFKFVVTLGLLLFISIFLWKIYPKLIPGESISEGIVGIYTVNTLPISVTSLLSKSLVSLDKNGIPQPELATWQVNNNATVYTFKLKDNLFWSNGEKLQSSDLKFNLQDVEITYPNNTTIEFKLADSFSPFPSLLTSPILKSGTFMGLNGKYKISHEEQNREFFTKIILTPLRKEDKLPIINIRFYPDERTAKTAFELGEVESLFNFSGGAEFARDSSVKVKKVTNFNKLVAIFYNTKDPILSDENFRQALSLATPKIDGEETAKTSIPPYSWAFNSELKESLGDPILAKQYFNKVGAGKDKPIILTTTPFFSNLGEKIIQEWKKIGIQAVLRVESGNPQNFQALLASQTIPTDPDQYLLWHTTQTKTNLSGYSNPRMDKNLEDGRKMGDMEKRKEKYLDFQKVLLDKSPATFLFFPKTEIVYKQKSESTLSKIIDLQVF